MSAAAKGGEGNQGNCPKATGVSSVAAFASEPMTSCNFSTGKWFASIRYTREDVVRPSTDSALKAAGGSSMAAFADGLMISCAFWRCQDT